jgi:uncharacterized protein YbjT (DUF2867 family)
MNILLFGATGMVGQSVLREALLDPRVTHIRSVGRTRTGCSHPKLSEVVQADLFDCTPVADQLQGFDACLFCLGVSAGGLSEAAYSRISFDLTLGVAKLLVEANPAMRFVYVSGAGTDSTEQGRIMWARVKGRTENALLRLPFKNAYMFRPGLIRPLHGVRSKTLAYRLIYTLTRPLLPLLTHWLPEHALTSVQVGQAMLNAVITGTHPSGVLESGEIGRMARGVTP